MELNVLLECLKLLWLGFEIVKHFINRKREKAMIEAIESLNHSLIQLEEKKKEFLDLTPVRGFCESLTQYLITFSPKSQAKYISFHADRRCSRSSAVQNRPREV